jgi:hypothetical protein
MAEKEPVGVIISEHVALATLFLASTSISWLTGVTLDAAGDKIML